MMTRIAVFAYGSLVDPASAMRTLEREFPPPAPARIEGWQRRWSVARDNRRVEKTFALEPGGQVPAWILGLNLEPGEKGAEGANGALLEVSEAELSRLDRREMRYERTDVTASLPAAGFDLVVAYTARPEHYAPEPPPGAVIIANYVRAVEAAFAALGDGELDAYLRTTATPPVEAVEATLVRDRIPAGNPRAW
jgi:cation transport regulator ChaC